MEKGTQRAAGGSPLSLFPSLSRAAFRLSFGLMGFDPFWVIGDGSLSDFGLGFRSFNKTTLFFSNYGVVIFGTLFFSCVILVS